MSDGWVIAIICAWVVIIADQPSIWDTIVDFAHAFRSARRRRQLPGNAKKHEPWDGYS